MENFNVEFQLEIIHHKMKFVIIFKYDKKIFKNCSEKYKTFERIKKYIYIAV